MTDVALKAKDSPLKELQDRLKELKEENARHGGHGDRIRAVERLIQQGTKSEEGLKAGHGEMKEEQKRLREFAESIEPDLKDHIQPDGVKAVDEIVNDRVSEMGRLRGRIVALKGVLPVPKGDGKDYEPGEVLVAQVELAEAVARHETAKTALSRLADLPGTIRARQDRLRKLRQDILRMSKTEGGREAAAFWLLTGGKPHGGAEEQPAPGDPDCPPGDREQDEKVRELRKELLPSSLFFRGLLDEPPEIVPVEEYGAKLAAAEKAESEAAQAVAIARWKHKKAEDELKAVEKRVSDLEKKLFQEITGAIEAWDQNRVYPNPNA